MPIQIFFPQKWPTIGVAMATMVLLLLNVTDKTLYHFAKIALKFSLSKILPLFLCYSLDIRVKNLMELKRSLSSNKY